MAQENQDKKKISIFDIIINIIIILLAILIIYWLIKLILGYSPELSEINFALILFVGGFLFKLYRETGEIKVEMRNLSIGVRESFIKVRNDINLIKNDATSIKKNMTSLKTDMNLIKKKLKV